ncbi:sulfite exporter TauE/SafE family protein [Roseomonas xinghualingensis]|uniref:sulfite exporter TauE/SafE family protein n=1 Tax=Roseomonas xinghualingensis TaxID=2986475 RepID=UPI0021F14B54|nr:sulfite exporter TauE/SafE family protein [Roseomonas sp. SXEYE001]
MDATLIAAIAATFTLAGFVKGVTGLGLPTIGVGLLSLVMPPAGAAAMMVVPSLVTNIWQIVGGSALMPLLRRLWPMMAGVCAGTLALGAGTLTGSSAASATMALGAALLLYGALGLSPLKLPRVSPTGELWLGPLMGIATGFVTAATGVFVLPAVPYLQALNLGRDDLVQALGLSFTVSTLSLAAILASGGAFGAASASTSLLALFPALAGMLVGGWVRRKIQPELFRRIFFLGLLLLGGNLMLRG